MKLKNIPADISANP